MLKPSFWETLSEELKFCAPAVMIDSVQKFAAVCPEASTPLTSGGKCLLEKVGGSKKIENWGKIFFDGKLPKIPKYT